MSIIRKFISERRYRAGYVVRKEIWTMEGDRTDKGTEMRAAYNPQGLYIGDPKLAHRLVVKRGIHPIGRTPNSNICSIGYSTMDGKWYGWSHRALFGFKVGSVVEPGTIGYQPSNVEEFVADLRRWEEKIMEHEILELKVMKTGVRIKTKSRPIKRGKRKGQCLTHKAFHKFPKKWGRGTWKAETLTDAMQMAMDFAEDIA